MLNVRAVGGFFHDVTSAVSVSEGGSTADLPETIEQPWTVGGVVTSPVPGVDWLGVRVGAAGGMTTLEAKPGGGIPSTRADGARADAGFDVFWRDPEAGFAGLGYRFRWEDPPAVATTLTRHGLAFETGIFIPDQGLGPIDWRADLEWGRSSPGGSALDEIGGNASSGWYLTDTWRFTGGFRWALDMRGGALVRRDLRGTADLAWLLPGFGDRRYVTARIEGSGGRAAEDLAAPLSIANRTVWSVGGALTVSWPGARTLVEQTRELH